MSNKRDLSVQWLLGCSTHKEREERKALIKGGTVVLDILKKIVEKERIAVQSTRESDYADSAWAYKQAHLNGRIEELDRLHHLIRSVTDHNDEP